MTGARGLLGHALAAHLTRSAPSPETLRLTDLEDLDVTDRRAVAQAIRDLRPRTVFHLAAWTDVDAAEAHPQEAARINVEAAEDVARAAADAGALIVHMSTDFIFDGSKEGAYEEDDPPSPLGVYARTKAESEARVRAAAPDAHLIVRTAWLYGSGGPNFVEKILRAAERGETLRVVSDQIGCPTWNEDLARALVAMVEADLRGTFHACGAGSASRWELAQEAVRAAGLDVPVQTVTSDRLAPTGRAGDPSATGRARARRPARVVLSAEKLARATGFRFPDWRQSVRAYVTSRR